MRTLALTIMTLCAVPLGVTLDVAPAHADFFTCTDKGGNTWVTNRKVKGARCKLAFKSPKSSAPAVKAEPENTAVITLGDDEVPVNLPAPPPQPEVVAATQGGAGSEAGAPPSPGPRPIIIYQVGAQAGGFVPAGDDGVARFTAPGMGGGRPGDEPRNVRSREALYAPYVEEAARLYDVPEPFVRAVIRVASEFRYRRRGPEGAVGLMQLRAATAREMRVADVYDPRENVLGGTRLVRELANAHDGDLVAVLRGYWAAMRGEDDEAVATGGDDVDAWVGEVLDEYYAYRALDE